MGAGGGAGQASAALSTALDQAGQVEWWRHSDAELAEAVKLFARAESRCAAAGVAVLAEAAERACRWSRGPGRGEAGSGVWSVTHAVAKQQADLAGAFGTAAKPNPDLAPTRAGFAAGEISVGHAGVLVRTMDAITAMPEVDEATRAEAQTLMLATALVLDPAQLGKAGLRLRHRLDPDAAQRLARDEDAQHERREAYLIQEGTGMWLLRAYLPPLVRGRAGRRAGPAGRARTRRRRHPRPPARAGPDGGCDQAPGRSSPWPPGPGRPAGYPGGPGRRPG